MFGTFLPTVIGEPFGVDTSIEMFSSALGLSAALYATVNTTCSPRSKIVF